jgi:hypothetical protein
MFFIIISAPHVSGGISAHHQELKNSMCSLGYSHAFLLSTSGREQEIMTIPKAEYSVLSS